MKTKRYEIKPSDHYKIVTDKKIRMNAYLKNNLDIFINHVQYDNDLAIMVDGREGCGKSTLAQQMGYYFSHKCGVPFGMQNVTFTSKATKRLVESQVLPKFSTVIWDEAYEDANKYRQMSKNYQDIVTIFNKARQFNFFFIMVLPRFYELASYFAIDRSFALIHCKYVSQLSKKQILEGGEIDFDKPVFYKGVFDFYTEKKKNQLYYLAKKFKSYDKVRPDFNGTFPAKYTIDEDEYRQKKAQDKEVKGITDYELIKELAMRGAPIQIAKDYSKLTDRRVQQIYKQVDEIRNNII